MITLDNEKDFYIKQMLKKDELISKKAEDVFNDFLEDKIKMKDKNTEKVVDLNKTKEKRFESKKILSIVATLVIVFLGANVYAATQGYNNIFFMIKNLANTGTISGKNEILKDQDITISYEPIEIAKGITVQFNRFLVKDNKAKLIMKIDQEESDKKISQVEVMNGHDDSQLVTSSIEGDFVQTTEEIEIGFFNNNINLLKININAKKENLAIIQIDLEKREITVLSNSYKEIEKISEIELKKALGRYAMLNLYEDMNESNEEYENKQTKKQYINYNLLCCAIEYISQKEITENSNQETIDYTTEKVHKAIKEMTGIEIKNYLDLPKESFFYYSENSKKYECEAGDATTSALCLNIVDISYEDGIYSADYQYCYPSESDYIESKIDELQVYESSLQFKLNDDYKYAKFCIVNNIYELKSNEVIKKKDTENSYENINITNTIDTNNTVNTNNTIIIEETDEYMDLNTMTIEYRDSDKIKNYKSFNYDLDGDGIIDKVTIINDTDNYGNYMFDLNGITFAENNMHPEIHIVDLNKNDSTIEVIIYDEGPSDDPEYSIYSKNENQMKLIAQIPGSNMVLNNNGNFKVKSIITADIIPNVYDTLYNFKDNKITSEENNLNKEQEYYSLGWNYITKDLSNIDKYFSYILKKPEIDQNEAFNKTGIVLLGPNDIFKIKSFIDESKAIVEYKGEEYYLISYQSNFAD